MSELGTLERKRLSDLHQIASQLGIEQYRKYRKPELAEMIYKVATEQAASQQAARDGGTTPEQTTNGGADTQESREAPGATAEATAEATTDAAPTTVVDGFGEADTVEVDDAAEVEQYREGGRTARAQEPPRLRQDRGGRGGEELIQSGILAVLPDGFGFLRTGGESQSEGR